MESDRDALEAESKAAEKSYVRTVALLKQGASTQERLEAVEAQYKSLQRKTKSADAQVEQAKLNLADTEIKAPADGTIAKKSVELGMMASAGQPVFGFVASDERWATANFKETEMKGISVGKTATIEVDAISGRTFEGVVESISPSTGATFSLLPPDNATGNFTKVVQRVPVRVRLIHLSADDIAFLQAGLSAEVRVKLH
jgi:membrane fusion protein (multidrug efflux system)